MKYYLKYHASSLVISMMFSVGVLAADNLSCSGPFGKLPPGKTPISNGSIDVALTRLARFVWTLDLIRK
jgi:hypothetical protein